MANELKKLVFVDPENPSEEYEIVVKGAEKALTALKDANGDSIHKTINSGYKKERYNYVLINEPENAKYDKINSQLSEQTKTVAVTYEPKEPTIIKMRMAKSVYKPSLNSKVVIPSPVIYKAKEETKLIEKVSLSS